jgi:hypothetical protein
MTNHYFKKNRGVLTDMLSTVIESYQYGAWETKQQRDDFKADIIIPYAWFIYNLNHLPIQSSSPLYKQIKFSDKLVDYCTKFKTDGIKAFVSPEHFLKFVNEWQKNLSDWLLNGLDDILKQEEAVHYRKAAFDNGSNLNHNFDSKFERDKEDALYSIKNKINKVNFG